MSSKKAPKNKCVANLHLSERRFRELPRPFCADARYAAADAPLG